MSTHDTTTPALNLELWHDVPHDCGRARPGVGHENPRVMDLSQRATTPDQQRIEDALEPLLGAHSRILHVGVGNSSLALRFSARVAEIVGLTLSEDECELANGLQLVNYHTSILNKYAAEIASVPGTFDIIVDNNPASFGCCMKHFQVMLAGYAGLLRPGGLLVTDRQGMDWCYDDGPMRLRFADLETIARCYPFEALKLNEQVFALRRRESD